MARADRLERLDALRVDLEADYRAALLEALRVTAAGTWGLFGHNEQPRAPRPEMVTDLCDRGAEIDEIRERLGLEPFVLHREFEDSRGKPSPQAPGEPKQAKAWLERLEKSS